MSNSSPTKLSYENKYIDIPILEKKQLSGSDLGSFHSEALS